jgi:Quinolinate synthetase A protein
MALTATAAGSPSQAELAAEAERLFETGLPDLGYGEEEIARAAGLSWKINRLKKIKNAVIPAHVYQRAEVIHGVADFVGDSYKLSRLCAESKAESVVFCGVRFMAETAKILSPEKRVLLPAPEAGCSLAESITPAQVRALKKEQHLGRGQGGDRRGGDQRQRRAHPLPAFRGASQGRLHPGRAHGPQPGQGFGQEARLRARRLEGALHRAREFRRGLRGRLPAHVSGGQDSGPRGVQPGLGRGGGFYGRHGRHDGLRLAPTCW